MEILKEFDRDYLVQAMAVFDSSKAPRSEDLRMVLEDTFTLSATEASWLYDAIICARPVIGELKAIRVIEPSALSVPLSDGSRRYGDFIYFVVR